MLKKIVVLKKIIIVALTFLSVFAVYVGNHQPVFSGYAKNFEVYLASPSSNARIVSVNVRQYPTLINVYGESFKANKENFDLKGFLEDFNAQIVFVESISEGTCYYAYSPKIKYRAQIYGSVVNLHVFVGDSVTIGAPIIFGSF